MPSAIAAKLLGLFIVVILLWPATSVSLIAKALLLLGGLSVGGALLIVEFICPR